MAVNDSASPIKPHIIIAAVIAVVVLAVLFWPAAEEEPAPVVEPAPIIEPQVVEPEVEPEPIEPEVFEPVEVPEPVVLEPVEEPEPMPEFVGEPEPEPLDVSDEAIETALIAIGNSDVITDFIVNDALLERFVVSVTNLADNSMAPNHRLLEPPEKKFRVYQQAEREWIDPASYKRYTPYVNAMEALDNERLLTLFDRYEGEIQAIQEQVGDPDDSFTSVFIDAIDTLLDTPEIKVPVEVYTESVMYKYKDEQLEDLSAPQKQLLRTGPDNMRRIKAKLREIKALLEQRGS